MIHRKYVAVMLNQMIDLLSELPNCLDLKCPGDDDEPLTVCGDVHGQVPMTFWALVACWAF